jgi:hypothetical protein
MIKNIKLIVKNQYEFLHIDLDYFGEYISIIKKDELFYFQISNEQFIKIEDELLEFFGLKNINEIPIYNFKVLSHKVINYGKQIEFECELELVIKKLIGSKIDIAKSKLSSILSENHRVIGIYLISIDSVNYIGQSTNIYRRLNEHIKSLSEGVHVNASLQSAWDSEFTEIKFEILNSLNHSLKPIERQEWLAQNEIKYIQLYSDENLSNETKGEFIPTKDSYAEYKSKNLTAEAFILDERKKKKIDYMKNRDELTEVNINLRKSIEDIKTSINLINSKKTTFQNFLSIFGSMDNQEKSLFDLKNIYEKNYIINRDKIFEINFQISQLKRRKFTQEEVDLMEKMGRKFIEELHFFK